MRPILRKFSIVLIGAGMSFLAFACMFHGGPGSASRHRWWAKLGPVLPHDTFPADCTTCHSGNGWHTLVNDFRYDHKAETGFSLIGAHADAQCLRCHNDRGPVAAYHALGCVGCHEDVHNRDLGHNCTSCHQQQTWRPIGQISRHNHTRFPLVGVHLATACFRCHPGAEVGNFQPTDTECVSCHRDDLAGTTNPPHIPLGLVNRCDRCHIPTSWHQAELN